MPINKISGQTALYPPMTIALAAGEVFILPAGQGILGTFGGQTQGFTGFQLTGQYVVNLGPYTSLQFLDSNLGLWRNYYAFAGDCFTISSDGTNFRLANTTGCPVGMVVTNAGSGLTNGYNTVSITASTGGSVWSTLVGGALATGIAVTGANITSGSNYTRAPILVFNPPVGQVTPYVLPSAICSIAAGTITSVTVLNQGAGLAAAPSLQILNQPGDTTGGGANLSANLSLALSGALVVAWPTQYSSSVGALAAAPTFTFSPASSIAATAVMNFVVTGVTTTAGGGGYISGTSFGVFTSGQLSGATPANINPDFDTLSIMPRNVSIQGVAQGGAIQTTSQVAIHDSGFGFQAVPKLYVIGGVTGGAAPTTVALVAAGVGGITDVSVIQPI